MRPTVAEQLRETRRILNDVLMPLIEDGYAAQIIKMAFDNLEMLETAWEGVLPFLAADNEATLALLCDLRAALPKALAMAIDDAASAEPCDLFDAEAMQSRNEGLQSLLCRSIDVADAEARRLIQARLLERTSRYPMRPKAAGLANAKLAGEGGHAN